MTSENYSGRKVDLLIFQGAQPAGMVPIVLSFGNAGLITTGIQKVVQTFTAFFFMDKGSVPAQPDYGTDFMRQMRVGYLKDESSVKSAFAFASDAAIRTMRKQAMTAGLPADETIASAKLLSYAISKAEGKLQMRVNISTDAGASRVVYLPIPVSIR